MKYIDKYQLFNFVVILLILLSGCNKLQKERIINFTLNEYNSEYQNSLISDFNSIMDSTFQIYIIDGNRDGKYFLKNDPRKDQDYPDILTTKDIGLNQHSGCELSDSIYLLYFQSYYLITIDIEKLTGSMELIRTGINYPDIILLDSVPDIQIISFINGKEHKLSDLFKKDINYYLVKNWAPFCAPCIKELNDIEENINTFKKIKVDFIYLVDSIYYNEVSEYFNSQILKERVYLCNYKEAEENMNFKGFPAKVLYSTNGRYIKRYSSHTTDSIFSEIKMLN